MLDALKQPGYFCWNELITHDVEGAKQFYSEMFGWQMEDTECSGVAYTTLKVNNDEVGGIMKPPAEADEMPPMWGSYVTVDDVDESAVKATQLGATLCVPPQDIPDTGSFCVIKDPQGAMISLFSFLE